MRLLGEVVPFISGIDTPEIGSHAKSLKERKLALIAKGRLRELLAEKGLRVMFSGAVDKTQTHRRSSTFIAPTGRRLGRSCRKASPGPGVRDTATIGATDSVQLLLLMPNYQPQLPTLFFASPANSSTQIPRLTPASAGTPKRTPK